MDLHQVYFYGVAVLLAWSIAIKGAKITLRPRTVSRRASLLLGLLAAAAMLLPVGEFTLWRWMFSVHANPSGTLAAALAAYVLESLSGRHLLGRRDWLALWCIGALAGALLYLPTLGFGHYDLYVLDWEGRWITGGATAVVLALLFVGNRAGVLLLFGLLAHLVDALESDNLWDYLIDPAYWLVSCSGLSYFIAGYMRSRRKTAPAIPEPSPVEPVSADPVKVGFSRSRPRKQA